MIVLNEREEFIVSQFKENMFNIDASILQTTFFTKSWVKYTDLDKDNFYKKLGLEPESIYINGDWIFTKERMFLIGVDKKKFFIKSVSFKSIS